MRPEPSPLGPRTDRDGRGWWWARLRAGQAAGTGRPGSGSAARSSAARSRRTAWGSVCVQEADVFSGCESRGQRGRSRAS